MPKVQAMLKVKVILWAMSVLPYLKVQTGGELRLKVQTGSDRSTVSCRSFVCP